MNDQNRNEQGEEKAPELNPDEARQAEIVLRDRRKRFWFFGFIAVVILLAILFGIAA